MTENTSSGGSYSCFYPLHAAAGLGDATTIETLICVHGFSPNETDFDYLTPLHVVSLAGHVHCVQLLIDYGAHVNARSIDGGTPLCAASAAGHTTCVKILLANGAMVNPPHTLSTPLHEAAFRGSTECVNLLIASGALLNSMDCNFGTPLHAAVFQNKFQCIRQLLLAGANVDATKILQTPLHLAVSMNHVESSLELIKFGADVFKSNNQGKRAIDLLPTQSGPLYEALKFAEKNPPRLKDLCRRTLNKNQFLKKMNSNFYFPKSLIEYIKYC